MALVGGGLIISGGSLRLIYIDKYLYFVIRRVQCCVVTVPNDECQMFVGLFDTAGWLQPVSQAASQPVCHLPVSSGYFPPSMATEQWEGQCHQC